MLNRIIRWSLEHRLAILGFSLIVLGLGFQALLRSPVDVLPDLNKPTVAVLTEGHGLASEEVESLVTFPIEAALNGIPGLTRLRSQSGTGLSVVWAEFDWGADIWRVRQLVAERLAAVRGQLPREAEPTLAPVSSIMGEIVWIGVERDGNGQAGKPEELRSFAEWTLRPRLLSIPGVAQVIVLGGGLKQVQIRLKAVEINRRQLGWSALRQSLERLGENSSGGFLDKEEKEYLVRNLSRPSDLEEIKDSIVGTWLGRGVRLRDIADVEFGPAPARGSAGLDGREGVILTVLKSPDADTLEVTARIDELIAAVSKAAPAGIKIIPGLFKQANFIRAAIGNVSKSLAEGGLLVVVILMLFLGSWRVSGIALTAIPLSFMATAGIMSWMGLSINTMTLGGLAIACGELVDDAIVDVENIFRRLKQARSAGVSDKADLMGVVFKASVEVRGSIVLATAIVVLAFLPMLTLDGIEGKLFKPLGVAYILSILSSLLISLTVTPVLASYLLPFSKDTARTGDSRLLALFKRWQEASLRRSLRHPKTILGVCALLVALAVIGFLSLGREFLPPFNESTSTVLLSAPPGISLAKSSEWGSNAEKIMLAVPEVAHVSRRTGRAENDEHAEGVQRSEIDVAYKPGGRSRAKVIAEIREKLEAAFPLAGVEVGAPIAHRVEHMLSGVPATLAIKIFGEDLTELRLLAKRVEKAIQGTAGLVDLGVEQQVLIPELRIALDRSELAAARLSAGETSEALELALGGAKVGSYIEGQRRMDIVARLNERERSDAGLLEAARLATRPDGSWIRLADLADVYESHGPNQVLRENMRRRIVVHANIAGRSLSETVDEVKKKLAAVTRSANYEISIEGQYAQQVAGQRRILVLGALALVGIFALLWFHYHSAKLALQIMANVPLALVGSVFALYLAKANVSLASLVAFITLCGISSRNGIMMVSHFLQLMRVEGEAFGEKLVIRGSLERLGPVLMTAGTAVLALTPFLLNPEAEGREILYPVAVVVVGGLVSSTLLDLFVTPVLFFHFYKPPVKGASRENNPLRFASLPHRKPQRPRRS